MNNGVRREEHARMFMHHGLSFKPNLYLVAWLRLSSVAFGFRGTSGTAYLRNVLSLEGPTSAATPAAQLSNSYGDTILQPPNNGVECRG